MTSKDTALPSPSPELRARVLARVASVPSRTREGRRRRVALGALAALTLTTFSFVLGGGVECGERPVELVVATAAAGMLVALVASWGVLRSSRSMLGPSSRTLVWVWGLTAPLLGVVALVASMRWPDANVEVVSRELHVGCGLFTVLQGALPLAALVAWRRKSDPLHPASTGAALGMIAGAWASVMAYLRCPHGSLSHAVSAHVFPTLVLALLGALIGRSVLAIAREDAR